MFKIKDLFPKKNIGIKIVSVFLAVFLWLNVALQKEYVTTFEMPIKLVNMPDYLMPSEPFPNNASVKISGKGKQLIGLKFFSDPKVMVDIFKTTVGERNVIMDNADVFLGESDIKVIAIEKPHNIRIVFDSVETKSVYVKNMTNFSTKDGYIVVGTPVVVPNYIKIKGPRKNLLNIDTVYTEKNKIEKLLKDTIVSVGIVPSLKYNVKCSVTHITINIKVQKKISRGLKGIPVHLINIPANVKASLDSTEISLVIEGPQSVVDNFTPNDLQIIVDYRHFGLNNSVGVAPSVVKFKQVKCFKLRPKLFRLSENFIIEPSL